MHALSHGEAAQKNEESGRIDEKLLRKYIADFNVPHYFVCGSPGFADAMRALFWTIGVSDQKIKYERFVGIEK